MPDADAMITTIKAHCRSLSTHDKEGWLSLWAEDAVLEDPVGVDVFRGRDALASEFWAQIESLSPMKLWLERDVIVCGNEAIALLSGAVTLNGRLRRAGPIVDQFTFDIEGKIASMRAFWNYAKR